MRIRRVRKLLKVWVFIFLFLLISFPVSVQGKTKTFVTFSMKVAEEMIKEANREGIDFRKKLPEVYYLGGISKPWAVVVDRDTQDFILVGERSHELPEITMDDWVVALKSRFIHAGEDPGVTINPRGDAKDAEIQDVKYFGGVDGTAFGQTCFEADWLMKKIGMELESVGVPGLKTYYNLSVEQARNRGTKQSEICSRFWFFPIMNNVDVADSMAVINNFQLGVFTELLYAAVGGQPVRDLDAFEDYPSEGFSRSFSKRYDELARAREVLEKLRSLTKLAGLAKGFVTINEKPDIDYWFDGYTVKREETEKTVKVLKVENREVGIEISGGVELAALALRIKGGEKVAFAETVLKTRPSIKSLTWTFGWTGEKILVGPPMAEMNQAAELFTQAIFLQKKKHYDDAITLYNKILEFKPDWDWPYTNRGVAYCRISQYEKGIFDFNKAIKINPNDFIAYNNRGLAFAEGKGQYDKAISEYNRALEINPNYAESYYNKGLAFSKGKGIYEQAIAEFTRALEINPRLAKAYNNRGNAFSEKGMNDKAISDYNCAIEINPELAEPYYNLGGVYGDIGDYDRAIASYNSAIEINSRWAEAYYNRGAVYGAKGDYGHAISDFNHALEISPIDNRNIAERLISKCAAIITERTNIGITALHIAANNGKLRVTEILISNGVDINARDSDGESPLHVAANNGHEEVLEFLIAKGASVDARTNKGWTALHYASSSGYKKAAEILINNGAGINVRETNVGSTPLHWAVYKGHKDLVKLLIDKGANVIAKNNQGITPIRLAESGGHKQILEMLRTAFYSN